MNDLLGHKASAAGMRKQMELSDKPGGRTDSTHQASKEEREYINENSASKNGGGL